jgi:hypothetical protein
LHREVQAEGPVEHVRVIQSAIVGNKQASIIPEVPLVVNGGLAQEVAGIMNQDIKQNGNVPKEGVIRGIPIILLGHIHKHKNLI